MDEDDAGPAFGAASPVQAYWSDLLDDMTATADEFRDRGWDVLELHPGDVTVVDAERRGFDVLVPDDEFEKLEAWVADCTFDEHDVYLAPREIVFGLVVLRDTDRERAVCCPLYYGSEDLEALGDMVQTEGRLLTHVRRLSEEYVTFVHEQPQLFFPEE